MVRTRHNTLLILLLVLLPSLVYGGESLDDLQPFYLTQQFARSLIERRQPQPVVTQTRTDIDRLIARTASRYHLNPNFIRAVVRVESNYDVQARSSAGAMGLMQLMPETARELGVASFCRAFGMSPFMRSSSSAPATAVGNPGRAATGAKYVSLCSARSR